MAIVYFKLDENSKLTEEQLKMLDECDKSPIVYDEDCPELTDEQIAKIREQRARQAYLAKKRNVSIRLSNKTIDMAKKMGRGYTNFIAEIVEKAFADESILHRFMGKM